MAVVFERANVAVSANPLGTVAGLQFVLVFQSPERGLRFHVALSACAKPARKSIRPQPTTGAISFVLKRNSGVAVLR